jgi:hypothetical protein
MQGVLHSCWERLTADQRWAVYEAHEALVSEWLRKIAWPIFRAGKL